MENVYYYLDGDVKVGPFSLDALKKAPITPNTLIWRNPFPQWVYAHTLPELHDLFVKTAVTRTNTSASNYVRTEPNYNKKISEYTNRTTEKKALENTDIPYFMPETYLPWAILSTVLCCMPLGIIAIIHSAKVSSAYKAGDYITAQEASEKAKKWVISTTIVGAFWYFFILYISLSTS